MARTSFKKLVAKLNLRLVTDKPLYYSVTGPETRPAKRMKTPKHPTLIRRFLQARQKQLQAKSPVLAASLVTIRRACGNPNCRCARGQKHLGYYLTWKVKTKTHTAYVPVDLRVTSASMRSPENGGNLAGGLALGQPGARG